jgi:hypothetical protein
MRRINQAKFWNWLKHCGACEAAMLYAWRRLGRGEMVKQTIRECENGEWLLWLAAHLDLPHKRCFDLDDVFFRPAWVAKQVRKEFTWGDFRDAMLKKGLGV